MPIIPIIALIGAFIAGRATAPHWGIFMTIVIEIIQHPLAAIVCLAIGYLVPGSIPAIGRKVVAAGKAVAEKIRGPQ